MTKYDKLKKKYDVLIKQSFEKNRRILLESFIEYYGEEFRNIIEKRYNEIAYIYYIDWNTVDFVINEFLPQSNNIDKYSSFIDFGNSRKKSLLSNLFERKKQQKKLPDNLIGMTNPSIVEDDAIVSWLFKTLSKSEPCSYNYGNVNHMNRLIAFQILALNEDAIIHEINHAITRDNFAYIKDNNIFVGVISKTGLSIDVNHKNSGERNLEELINEKASKEIAKIFKSKGGDFSDFCLNIPLEYAYEYNFYLVDDFYSKFKEYIKIARMSENKNELISRIGKKEYEEFVRLVNKCYTDDISKIELRKEKMLPEIKELIEKMHKKAESSQVLSRGETNKYVEQLIKSGYNLRMLDYQANDFDAANYKNNNGITKK